MESRARSVCYDMKEVSQSKDWSYNLRKLLWYFLFDDHFSWGRKARVRQNVRFRDRKSLSHS